MCHLGFIIPLSKQRESSSAGQAMGLPVLFHHGLSVRPPTDLVFAVFWSASVGRRFEPCRLVVVSLWALVGSRSLLFVSYLLPRYMWPKGPWQRRLFYYMT